MKRMILILLLSMFTVGCSNDDNPFTKSEKQDYDKVKQDYIDQLRNDLKGEWYFKDVVFNDLRISEKLKNQMKDIESVYFEDIAYSTYNQILFANLRVKGERVAFSMPIQPIMKVIGSLQYKYERFYAFEPSRFFYEKDHDHLANILFCDSYVVNFKENGDIVFDSQNKNGTYTYVLEITLSREL